GAVPPELLQALIAHPDTAVNPTLRATLPAPAVAAFNQALAAALHAVFLVGLGIAALALAAGFLVPAGRAQDLALSEAPAPRPSPRPDRGDCHGSSCSRRRPEGQAGDPDSRPDRGRLSGERRRVRPGARRRRPAVRGLLRVQRRRPPGVPVRVAHPGPGRPAVP